MKKILLTTVAVALVYPATAGAKELAKLDACGASGCATLRDRDVLMRIGEGSDGESSAATPALQPFYKLVYTVRAQGAERFGGGRESFKFTIWYVPRARETSGTDEQGNPVWQRSSSLFVDALRRLTRGVTPFAAPRITRVTVGGRVVDDPRSYTELLTVDGDDPGFVTVGDWQAIRFSSPTPSPWTRDTALMLFSPKTGILARDYRYFKLPGDLAGAVRDRGSLAREASGGFPAWGYGPIAAAVVLAWPIVALRRRRRENGSG